MRQQVLLWRRSGLLGFPTFSSSAFRGTLGRGACSTSAFSSAETQIFPTGTSSADLFARTRMLCCARTSTLSLGMASSKAPLKEAATVATAAVAHSKDDAAQPVDPAFILELKELLIRSTPNAWHPIAELYTEIPTASRRAYVKPHKTLMNVLRKSQNELQVHMNEAGTHFAIGATAPLDSTETQRATSSSSVSSSPPPASSEKMGTSIPVSTPTRAAPLIVNSPDRFVDFYYDVQLTKFPAPPADFDVTPSALPSARGTEDGTVIALRSFLAFIPPFFVPMSEVLARMPGYAEGHIIKYFSTKAMEIVNVGERRFVRLYGGYAKLSLEGCEVAEEAFAHYRPDISLAAAFATAFGGVTNKWMPLELLLKRADPRAVARLPFLGPEAIIYFAQMQHLFKFASGNDGGAVLLLDPGSVVDLTCETTPTPKSCNYLLSKVPLDGSVDLSELQATIPDHLMKEIKDFFGDLPSFFKTHGQVFHMPPDASVVMRESYRNRLYVASLPLEEQLEIAIKRHNKTRVRAIRRRIAFRDNPSHPFHDPDNLAQEISKYLPHRGHVLLKHFLKKNIPEELLNYLPAKIYNFFSNYPQYFQQFEYQQAGTWCVCRVGLPLPRGVIRKEFSEADLLQLVAEYVQTRATGRPCTDVYLNLPRGAQDVIKKKHGGIYHFVVKYPQYFNVVLGSDTENAKSSAVIHLLQLPPVAASSSDGGAGHLDSDAIENDDE